MKVWNKRPMNTSRKAERREVEEAEGAGSPLRLVGEGGGRRSSADFNPGLSTRLSGITAKREELQDRGRR